MTKTLEYRIARACRTETTRRQQAEAKSGVRRAHRRAIRLLAEYWGIDTTATPLRRELERDRL